MGTRGMYERRELHMAFSACWLLQHLADDYPKWLTEVFCGLEEKNKEKYIV